jgi:hypothetical protein
MIEVTLTVLRAPLPPRLSEIELCVQRYTQASEKDIF